VAVCGQLDATGEPSSKVMDEMVSRATVTCSDLPAGHQLRLRVHANPSPNITPAVVLIVGRDVLFFAADERPNFIALNALAVEVAENLVLIF
jgi:hypothetical protein